jgi:hypothetical protein
MNLSLNIALSSPCRSAVASPGLTPLSPEMSIPSSGERHTSVTDTTNGAGLKKLLLKYVAKLSENERSTSKILNEATRL